MVQPVAGQQAPRTVFLLSPASCNGRRTGILVRPEAAFDLAVRMRSGGAAIGEVFAFLSGLYFRGKLAYATAFGRSGPGLPAVWVITPSRGLVSPGTPVDAAVLQEFAGVEVSLGEPRYRSPMELAVAELAAALGPEDRVVLLGSIATGKYVDLLAGPLGERLVFPAAFVGRGDMSRGGLMLRCVESGEELDYVPVSGAVRHGGRPPRLAPRSPARGRP